MVQNPMVSVLTIDALGGKKQLKNKVIGRNLKPFGFKVFLWTLTCLDQQSGPSLYIGQCIVQCFISSFIDPESKRMVQVSDRQLWIYQQNPLWVHIGSKCFKSDMLRWAWRALFIECPSRVRYPIVIGVLEFVFAFLQISASEMFI